MNGQPFDEREAALVEAMADWSLEIGKMIFVRSLDIMVVPDVVMLEVEANGEDLPPGLPMNRGDGRRVFVYHVTAEIKAVLG